MPATPRAQIAPHADVGEANGAVTVPVDADVARSAALLTAVGFSLIPLAQPVAGVWDLLAVSPRGLTLVAAVSERPNLMGCTYGAVPGWPTGTVRLILVWGEAALPTAITLT